MKRISAGSLLFLCLALCVGSAQADKRKARIEGKTTEYRLTILHSANTLGVVKPSG